MFYEADYNIILFYQRQPSEPDKQLEIAHLFIRPASVQRTVKFYAFEVPSAQSTSNAPITLTPIPFNVKFSGESNFKYDDAYFDQNSKPEPIVRPGEYPFECTVDNWPVPKGGHTHPPGPAGVGT